MKTLENTVQIMLSEDYKDRFRAEYLQLRMRYRKLYLLLTKNRLGALGFKPDCPIDLLKQQLEAMRLYISLLEERAIHENIDLGVEI